MDDREFIQVVSDRAARIARYRAAVIEYYNRVTDGYRQRWGDSFHLPVFFRHIAPSQALVSIEQRVAAECALGPRSEVLDVGCGVGGPSLTVAAHSGARVTGVNIVPYQVAIARRRAVERGLSARARFVVADGMRLPFPEGAFDAVVIFESGCHMPDKARFYRECARVLRVGGRFAGIDWMKAAGLDADGERRYIEPICRLHAIAYLIDRPEFEQHLAGAGLHLELFQDLTAESGLARGPNGDLADVFCDGVPPVQVLLGEGGRALTQAARAGAFELCLWRAKKSAETAEP